MPSDSNSTRRVWGGVDDSRATTFKRASSTCEILGAARRATRERGVRELWRGGHTMRFLSAGSRWIVGAAAGAAVLACANSAADEARSGKAGADPRRDMVAGLPALGPHPSLGDAADLFR